MGLGYLRGCAILAAVAGVAAVSWGQVQTVPPAVAPAADAAVATGGNITVNFEGTGADVAFDQVSKLAGIELNANGDQVWVDANPIFLKVDKGYFWPTFMEMCAQAGLRFDVENRGQGQTILRLSTANKGLGQYASMQKAGAQGFVIMPTYANRNYSVSYENKQSIPNGNMSIQVMVLVDPSAPISQLSLVATEAVDENGTSLILPNRNGGSSYGGNMGSPMQNAGINLAAPMNIGKKLVSLKGSMRGMAVIKTENVQLTLPLPAEGKTYKTSDFEVVIRSLKPKAEGASNKQYELMVDFVTSQERKGGLRRSMSNDQWSLINAIVLKDANGKRYQVNGGGGGGGSNGVTTYTVIISGSDPQVGEPATLQWKLPLETKAVSIPFEFKDLVLP